MKKTKQIVSLIDLTSLSDNETIKEIEQLCKKADTKVAKTASVCIYPRYIPYAKSFFKKSKIKNVKVATVVNFPHGNADIDVVLREVKASIAYGADEVDLVFPYKALMSGDEKSGYKLVQKAKNICKKEKVLLKVIIESGELKSPKLIKKASEISIKAGADFIKTSTGKVKVNATLKAAKVMLQAIKESKKRVGFKAAGGIKDKKTALKYLELAENIMGKKYINKKYFRFGASSLLDDLLS